MAYERKNGKRLVSLREAQLKGKRGGQSMLKRRSGQEARQPTLQHQALWQETFQLAWILAQNSFLRSYLIPERHLMVGGVSPELQAPALGYAPERGCQISTHVTTSSVVRSSHCG